MAIEGGKFTPSQLPPQMSDAEPAKRSFLGSHRVNLRIDEQVPPDPAHPHTGTDAKTHGVAANRFHLDK